MTCTISFDERRGWRAVVLENERARIVLLPDKGAEVHELVDLASGVDALFKAPWGLQPPGAPPRAGSDGTEFLQNYGGGWQELFPSAGDACTYRGRDVPVHGEVAVRPWEVRIVGESAEEVAAEFSIRCETVPVSLRRTVRLRQGSPAVTVEETASNDSSQGVELVWGHHLVLGPPFIEAGCTLDVPARRIVTLPEPWEETARLLPGQDSSWPEAKDRSGGTVDLSQVPGPEALSHDDVYLTGLSEGRIAVHNPRLDLRFTMGFDRELFPWIVSWQACGGARAMPLAGSYALGVEPWSSRLNLEQAAAAGVALELAGGSELATTLTVCFEQG
jgi:galactose mutarotase-like enzyme